MDKLTIKEIEELAERLDAEGADAFSKQYSLGMWKLCAEAASALRHLLNERMWRPIDSAPHETWVLLAEPPAGDRNGEWLLKVGMASWCTKPGTRGRAGHATHWLTLPPSPEENGDV